MFDDIIYTYEMFIYSYLYLQCTVCSTSYLSSVCVLGWSEK